ncbi:hypothetical protein K458DRAFT_314456 [Lentithecium fluviatile CBS 122367]|uniref:Peptidase metallopeptidase domain-containing protein n=1 Tax=Lentithecium fluviatile CBS 122367 TaxID=1168545 RepID=A0A6G1IM30_9PLEO|nr:hypothetical protein K458DRAFT_314456 [Lentithecium fluviatile CBS 122367]
MRIRSPSFLIGVVVCYILCIVNHATAQGTSLIPSASPLPKPSAVPQGRADRRKQSKNVHDFFKAFGWLRHNETIPDAQFPAAVRRIQKVLREPPTGVYDQHMESVMSRPRCGTIPPYNPDEAKGDKDIRKRYVIWGPKWDHSPITYRFNNFTADLPADRQKSIVSAAFTQWTKLLPISIAPAATNAPKADIHVRFMSMGPDETAYAFTNMIADGLALSSGLINITFNDDYNWSDDRLFAFTATHEIGHALGLSHSRVEDAVMFLYYEGMNRPIHPDDQAAVHTVYGWKNPRWSRIDGNSATRNLIQVSSATTSSTTPALVDGIYQLRSTGQVLWYNPSGTWTSVDNNKDTVQIAGANGYLYQRHADGSTYKYSGAGTNWQWIGAANDNVIDIVAAADQVYMRRKDGWIARWSGTAQTWTAIQQPSSPSSAQIAVTDSKTLWNLLSNGDIVRSEWPYSATSWQIVDINPANIQIAVGGENFYKLQSDGSVIWLDMEQYYWADVENAGSVAIYAVGNFLYSRHADGSVWRYTGTPGIWEMLDERKDSVAVVGDRSGGVYEMVKGGDIYKLVS